MSSVPGGSGENIVYALLCGGAFVGAVTYVSCIIHHHFSFNVSNDGHGFKWVSVLKHFRGRTMTLNVKRFTKTNELIFKMIFFFNGVLEVNALWYTCIGTKISHWWFFLSLQAFNTVSSDSTRFNERIAELKARPKMEWVPKPWPPKSKSVVSFPFPKVCGDQIWSPSMTCNLKLLYLPHWVY